MKLLLFLTLISTCFAEMKSTVIPHQLVGDTRLFARDVDDKKSTIRTEIQEEAVKILESFSLLPKGFLLPEGHVLVVFLHDVIREDLVSITRIEMPRRIYGDYADSGIRFDHLAPPKGKKWSHVTAVTFASENGFSDIGIRAPLH